MSRPTSPFRSDFDSLGKKANKLRLVCLSIPSSLRRGTLVYYTQIIFLGFSGVYIIKEAVESVTMSGSDDDHGHGGHSHSAKYPEYPTVLIACSTVSALVSSCYLGNHVKLLEGEFCHPSPSLRAPLTH